MTYRRILLLVGIVLAFSISSHAQSTEEVLRYSSISQVGTARNIALGGSMGSIGADFSILTSNPAGLSRFKSTEFQISPNIAFGNTKGTYLGNTLSDEHVNFNLSSAGIAFARTFQNSKNWKGISIGFGMNRLNQYNDDIFISGSNTNSSILDLHAAVANGTNPNSLVDLFPFDAGLSGAIELLYVDSNNNYSSVFQDIDPQQDITITRKGGKYEAALGVSGNYNDKIYLGASLGIPIIQFTETEIIKEQNPNSDDDYVNFFDIRNDVRTTGYGFNFKMGIMGKPHKYVRLGAAFHTPTLIRFTDQYSTVMTADNDSFAYEAQSPQGLFEYSLISPWKFVGNAGFLMGKYGFISTEYELHNHGKSKYKFQTTDADIKREEQIRNGEIANTLDWQHHMKLGVEFKLNPVRVRAGFQYKTSGLGSAEPAELVYSGGIGYRGKHIFVDGAYSFTKSGSTYTPYEFGNISSGNASFDQSNSQVTFTVGYKL